MPRSHGLALFVALGFTVLSLSGCSDSTSPPTSSTVTLQVFDTSYRPVATSAEWAAFQDGNKAWAVLAPSATGVYTATVTDAKGRFGFALFADGDLHLQQGTAAEGTSLVCFLDTGLTLAKDRLAAKRANYAIHGTISYDFTPGESMVAMGRSRSASSPIAAYWFTVPAGLHDLVISDNSWGTSRVMSWLYFERGLDIQANLTHDVTVTSAQRVMLEDGASLQVTGDAADASATIALLTANGTWAMLANHQTITGGAAPFRSVPVGAMANGDRYEVQVARGQWRKTACYGSAAGLTVDVPTGGFPTFAVSTVDAGGACYPVFSGLSMPDGKGYFMYCGASTYFIDAIVSSGWLAANGTTSCQVPDLTGLAGWQVGWSLPASTVITDQDAVFLDGNVALAKCVRYHFNDELAPLAAGEWVSTLWGD